MLVNMVPVGYTARTGVKALRNACECIVQINDSGPEAVWQGILYTGLSCQKWFQVCITARLIQNCARVEKSLVILAREICTDCTVVSRIVFLSFPYMIL